MQNEPIKEVNISKMPTFGKMFISSVTSMESFRTLVLAG